MRSEEEDTTSVSEAAPSVVAALRHRLRVAEVELADITVKRDDLVSLALEYVYRALDAEWERDQLRAENVQLWLRDSLGPTA